MATSGTAGGKWESRDFHKVAPGRRRTAKLGVPRKHRHGLSRPAGWRALTPSRASRTDVAWMLTAGFAVPLGEGTTLDLAWRYTDLGVVRTGAVAVVEWSGATVAASRVSSILPQHGQGSWATDSECPFATRSEAKKSASGERRDVDYHEKVAGTPSGIPIRPPRSTLEPTRPCAYCRVGMDFDSKSL